MVQGRKTNPVVFPTPEERRILESRQRSTTISRGLARRGQIILMLSDGASISEISRTIGIARGPIYKWAKRFRKKRLDGLKDKPGRGRRPFFPSGGGSAFGKDGLREA